MRVESLGTAIAFGAAQLVGARSADVPNLYGVPLTEENPHSIFENGYGSDPMFPQAQTPPECTIPALEAAYPDEMHKLADAAERLSLGNGVVTAAGLGMFAGPDVAAACPNGLALVEAAYGGQTQPTNPDSSTSVSPIGAPPVVPEVPVVVDDVEQRKEDALGWIGCYAAGVLALAGLGIGLLRRSSQSEVGGGAQQPPRKEVKKHNPWREQEISEKTPLQAIEEQGRKRLRPVDTSAHTLGRRNITYGSGPSGGWHPRDGANNPVYYHTDDSIVELKTQVKSHISLWQRLQQWGGGSYDHDLQFKSNEQRAITASRILRIAKGNRAIAAELYHETSAGRKTFQQAQEYLDQFE